MWNKRTVLTAGFLACALVAAGVFFWPTPSPPPAPVPAELPRAGLTLRDGRMCPLAGGGPYTGIMFERSAQGKRLTEVPLKEGLIQGVARGWYDSGQLEVEETYLNGVSQGVRRRWHQNGQLKSEATIVAGKLHGPYTEWHDNGKKAAHLTLVEGKPEGLSEAWHPDGSPKAVVVMKEGKPVKQEFFPIKTVAQQP